jgi:type II secretory pathway pseudopilin PulG
VLVVVAIIALLISIMLPSLRAAREEAKLVVDQANCKQIATMVSLYQADFKGRVPVMLGYGGDEDSWAWQLNQNVNGQDTVPARTMLLSLPLRRYTQDRRGLPPQFKPEVFWEADKIDKYEKSSLLSDYFVCPFSRDKAKQKTDYTRLVVTGPNGSSEYQSRQTSSGRSESYRTWMWPRHVVRNERPTYATGNGGEEPLHPNDPKEGRPKYSALAWNNLRSLRNPGGYWFNSLALKDTHRDWANDARDKQLKSASLSDLTILYCAQGQRMQVQQQYYNVGSHRRNNMGGTNVIFADTHVEWVKGTQVGW